jgi:hypothetical protein
MSKTVTIAVSCGCSGDGIVQYTYTPQASPLQNSAAAEAIPSQLVLGTGSTTVTVPVTAKQALIVPLNPTTNTNAKTVKTTMGDVGISFANTPVLIPVVGGTSLYFTATAAETLDIVWG